MPFLRYPSIFACVKQKIIRVASFLGLALTFVTSAVAQPKPETVAAFDRYVSRAEIQMRHEESSPDSFLGLASLPVERAELDKQIREGKVLVYRQGSKEAEIPDGLIHDWVGLAFLPKITIAQTIAFLQDYDHLARYYAPEVISSRLISHDANDFQIAMRLRKHNVITVVLDTEYNVHYGQLDAAHQYSVSRSTKISEVPDNTGLPSAAPDHGFLWRLNTYWRFEQQPDGVIAECEAISLTRDIPTGLGWLITPYIQKIPRESLEFTLDSTRKAVLERARSHPSMRAGLR